MLSFILLAAMLVILGAPQTSAGKALRRALVEWPAERLSRISRGTIVCVIGLAVLLGITLWLMQSDATRFWAMAAPDTMAWFSTFEISTLADALVAVALIAANARLGAAFARARAALGTARSALRRRLGSSTRQPRSRRPAERKGDNDDGDGWAGAFAIAA